MLSSNQVAALFQQQQQAFTGVAQYAQSIGAMQPPAWQGAGTIGTYGVGGPPAAQFANAPYAPANSAGYNFGAGAQGAGYGPGNWAGSAGVSAIGGGLHAGSQAFSTLAGLGMLGRVAGAGFGLPAAGIGMVGSHIASSMVTGAQQQAGIEQVLGQHQFANAASRTGRGFSRQDAMAIGDMARNMAHLPELMTSMGEITRVMDKVGQMGVMQGVRDAEEFQRRFKQTFKTLQEVAKVMGTTTEDAAAFFGEAKRSGIYSTSDIVRNAMNRQAAQSLTGMTQQQVAATQLAGAQINFQMGGRRGTGAVTALRTASQLGAMTQMGMLSPDQIMEMTGATDPRQGLQQLTQTMQVAAHKMARSSMGRVMAAALGEVKGGEYTGRIDVELARRARAGDLSRADLMRIARRKTSGRRGKLSFVSQERKLTAETASQVGVEGMAAQLNRLIGERGFSNAHAQRIVAQKFGLSERESEIVNKYAKALPEIQSHLAFSRDIEAGRMARQKRLAEESPGAIARRISTKIHNVVSAPFEKIGASIRNRISGMTDDLVDELTGTHATELSRVAQELSAGGGGGYGKFLEGSLARGPGGRDLRRTFAGSETLGGLIRGASGLQNDAADVASLFRGGAGTTFRSVAEARAAGADVLGTRYGAKGWGEMFSGAVKGSFAGFMVGGPLGGALGGLAGGYYKGRNASREVTAATAEERAALADQFKAISQEGAETAGVGSFFDVLQERGGGNYLGGLQRAAASAAVSPEIQRLTGMERYKALVGRLRGTAGFGQFEKGIRAIGGPEGAQQQRMVEAVERLVRGGGLSAEYGVAGGIAKQLGGIQGGESAEYYAGQRQKLERQLQGDLGEDYAGLRKAVLGDTTMSRLLVGRGGALEGEGGLGKERFRNLSALAGQFIVGEGANRRTVTATAAQQAEAAKALGVNGPLSTQQRKMLARALHTKSWQGQKGGLRRLAALSFFEGRALDEKQQERAGGRQKQLLESESLVEGLSGVGKKDREKASQAYSALYGLSRKLTSKTYEKMSPEERGQLAEDLAKGLTVKGKGGNILREAYGGVAKGLALTARDVARTVKATGKRAGRDKQYDEIGALSKKYGISRDALNKIAVGGTFYSTKDKIDRSAARRKLIALVARKRQGRVAGKAADVEGMKNAFSKFVEGMQRVGTVFQNVADATKKKKGGG